MTINLATPEVVPSASGIASAIRVSAILRDVCQTAPGVEWRIQRSSTKGLSETHQNVRRCRRFVHQTREQTRAREAIEAA